MYCADNAFPTEAIYDYVLTGKKLEEIIQFGIEKVGKPPKPIQEGMKFTLNGEAIGLLIFYNCRAADNLPEVIHQTTVLLKRSELEVFDQKISEIFKTDFLNANGFISFSIN